MPFAAELTIFDQPIAMEKKKGGREPRCPSDMKDGDSSAKFFGEFRGEVFYESRRWVGE